jgi:hypothetical protein
VCPGEYCHSPVVVEFSKRLYEHTEPLQLGARAFQRSLDCFDGVLLKHREVGSGSSRRYRTAHRDPWSSHNAV